MIKILDADGTDAVHAALRPDADPLAADSPFDRPVATTDRGLARLALVATETAFRFAREGREDEAMRWLTGDSAMFAGRSPIQACVARDACSRAVLLHALEIDPEDGDEVDDIVGRHALPLCDGERADGLGLYTAVVARGPTQGFVAAVCGSLDEMRGIVSETFGPTGARECEVRHGSECGGPEAGRWVSPAMAGVLAGVAAGPALGFRLLVERRMDA